MRPLAGDPSWPPFVGAAPGSLRQLLDGLGASQHWPAAEMQAGQQRQLASLLQWAAAKVPYYRRSGSLEDALAVSGAHPEQFWREWSALPILAKTGLREHGAALNARSLPKSHRPAQVTRTSGSLGIPVEVRTTSLSRLVWNALTIREHFWFQRNFSKRLGIIRHRHARNRSPDGELLPSWGPPISELYRTGPASVIHISLPIGTLTQWLTRFDPHYLLTYPSVATALLETLGSSGKPPALEDIRLMSEPLDSELERRLRGEWRLRVSDMYSANEVGHIAFRCPEEGRLHVQAEAILVEILNERGDACGTGETGRVVVTALHNIATPLIRYDLGDYATVGAPCPCGRTLPVIEKVLGRVRNLVRTPDARRFWPSAMGGIRTIRPIRQAQYVQTALDQIELRAVLDRSLTPAEEQQAAARVREILGYPFHVVIRSVNEIPRGPTGKFEEFLSTLAD